MARIGEKGSIDGAFLVLEGIKSRRWHPNWSLDGVTSGRGPT